MFRVYQDLPSIPESGIFLIKRWLGATVEGSWGVKDSFKGSLKGSFNGPLKGPFKVSGSGFTWTILEPKKPPAFLGLLDKRKVFWG